MTGIKNFGVTPLLINRRHLIMGSAGQYSAVSFYEGNDAAHQFLLLQERALEVRPDDILLIPYVMVSFDDRQFLQTDERKRIRDLGYSLPDRNKWPVFQHVVPGHPPIFSLFWLCFFIAYM